jgi:type 1 fimbria pilin
MQGEKTVRKILFLGLILALLAVVAVPAVAFAATTGGTDVTGTFVAPTLSITTPDSADLVFPDFVQGWNYAGPGTLLVTFSQGSSQYTGWMVTALGDANMKDGATPLSNYLLIGDGIGWLIANGGGPASIDGGTYGPGTLTYTGAAGVNLPFSFNAAQWIVPSDSAGTYTDTITFTASMTP